MKKQINITIEKSKDCYAAYSVNVEGIYGMGDSVAETKKSIEDAISIIKGFDKANIPSALQVPYELVYQFDTQSLLKYYKGIFTNAALERITGINQKQLQHYASGLKRPRLTQAKKIEQALHKLGDELQSVKLV